MAASAFRCCRITIRRSANCGSNAAAPASSPISGAAASSARRWHEAGRREGKRLSHDDFAAVAADLVRRGVTRPGRIAAEGGSNGGILITNMLTRYPERFGALFCTIPLIDMRRYAKLHAGASWIAEYGDPDNPEDWAFLQEISAYHAAEPGRRLSADPARDKPARRPRPSRPCPQDGGEIAGDGLRSLFLRARRRRPRLWQGQPRARRLHRARLQFFAPRHRLAARVMTPARTITSGRRRAAGRRRICTFRR